MKRSAAEGTLLVLCLAALIAALTIGSHWPLAGDSVLMHYVVWLSTHGFAPYRDIAEMNLPLTYISERAAMTVFGAGDLGWRLYDGIVILSIVLTCWRLLQSRGAASGVFAATLFAAVHLQDGVHMAGQRDLLVALCQAVGGLALLRSWCGSAEAGRESAAPVSRVHVVLWSIVAGACCMAAGLIKPPALLFFLTAIAWRVWPRKGQSAQGVAMLGAILGAAAPLLACVLYLQHYGAAAAFLQDLHGLIAYHASIERRSAGFLLGHAWSPVAPLLLVTIVALLLARSRTPWTRVERLCAIGVTTGLLSYVIQGKGFPYQRYPLLLWLLLLCASRVSAAWQPSDDQSSTNRLAFYAPVATGLVLVAIFLIRSTHFSSADPYAGLRGDLRVQSSLDGQVQCLDTAGPCIGALYKERLTQTTGFLYDCYLLDGSNPVVQQQRALFTREWLLRPPRWIVLTDSNCFTGPRTFDKYAGWPWMQQQLTNYAVVLERHPQQPLHLWTRPEQPYAYRILQRR